MIRDQIRGMYLGVAIGDALGMPVEGFTPEKILEVYPATLGKITEYLEPIGHKWFDGEKAGTWTDDTQLTLAISNALVEDKGLNINTQIKHHIEALKASDKGWGKSTRESIRRLSNGVPYNKSGEDNGRGNGVVMKITPIAAYLRYTQENKDSTPEEKRKDCNKVFLFLRDLTLMTHNTQMAIVSSFSHLIALSRCLRREGPDAIVPAVVLSSIKAQEWKLTEEIDDLAKRFEFLGEFEKFDRDRCIQEFGGGSCYCYNSLPFSYMFYLRDYLSIDSMYNVISAGGDADTNGSIVGAMLGAYHGTGIFPEHLIEGLDQRDMILKAADDFCDCFDIN